MYKQRHAAKSKFICSTYSICYYFQCKQVKDSSDEEQVMTTGMRDEERKKRNKKRGQKERQVNTDQIIAK